MTHLIRAWKYEKNAKDCINARCIRIENKNSEVVQEIDNKLMQEV